MFKFFQEKPVVASYVLLNSAAIAYSAYTLVHAEKSSDIALSSIDAAIHSIVVYILTRNKMSFNSHLCLNLVNPIGIGMNISEAVHNGFSAQFFVDTTLHVLNQAGSFLCGESEQIENEKPVSNAPH